MKSNKFNFLTQGEIWACLVEQGFLSVTKVIFVSAPLHLTNEEGLTGCEKVSDVIFNVIINLGLRE